MIIPKKILFILHEATESGAPMVVFSFMQWLKKNTDVQFDCYVVLKGNLSLKLRGLCSNVYEKPQYKPYRVREKFQRFLTRNKMTQEEVFFKKITDNNYDFIYLNSIFSIPEFRNIEKYFSKPKKILHLHEAQFLISYFEKLYPEIDPIKNIDLTIAVSKTAQANFLEKYHYPHDKIKVIYPHLEKPLRLDDEIKINIREQLGIAKETFVIGNIGNPHLVKTSEMLPILASILTKKYPQFNFKLLIVGGEDNNIFTLSNKIDAKKLQVTDKILFIDHQSDIIPYLQIMNIYAMISREESFSLMTVMAALSHIPIISFKDNGGPEELLSDDFAILTDYLDYNRLADAIYESSKNPEKLNESASKAYNHFQNIFSGGRGNKEIWSVIKSI